MPQPPFIFICYRREDSSGHAHLLYNYLIRHFSREQIFMDIDVLRPGQDFVEVIESAVQSCRVVIVVIGRQWLSSADLDGRRKLDNPEDWVRLEIVTALERNILVIPVLVHGATMPRSIDLPAPLSKLTRLHALDLNHERYWQSEIEGLVKLLEEIRSTPAPAPAPIPAPAPVVEEPPEELHIITTPIVGTFYSMHSPAAEPFVRVGSAVEPGTVVCIIEAMKLMNEIEAETSGTVAEIYVANGQPVEYGQPLFGISKMPDWSRAPRPDKAAAVAPPPYEEPASHDITAPIIGTFYRASSPTSTPFVKVGSNVEPDTVVCIIEMMGLMNEIRAEVAGTVEKLYVENGQPVEYGQPLFRVETTPKETAPPHTLESPTAGVFYWSFPYGAEPYVKVGGRVETHTVVGVVEVMMHLIEIPAGAAGVVEAVYVENGALVDHGQPLLRIRRE